MNITYFVELFDVIFPNTLKYIVNGINFNSVSFKSRVFYQSQSRCFYMLFIVVYVLFATEKKT